MLLTLSTSHAPATDLGYLLAKNPARTQSFDLSFGQAHVFYPEVGETRCTAALLLDVDPIVLSRGRGKGEPGTLEPYVNDRPYVASSFSSVAIAQVFGSALAGRSRERQALAETPIDLEARLDVVPCRGGETFLRRLFEPLGYHVGAERVVLDEAFPEWGASPYFRVTLARTCTVRDLLTHLYVLLPVLDDRKHYWVGEAEVDNLLAKGEGWLASHPERAEVTARYLKHRRPLVREALERLVAVEDPAHEESAEAEATQEEAVEARISLDQLRLGRVVDVLRDQGARSVLDLGCGEGKLLRRLLDEQSVGRIAGADVSLRSLEIAKERLRWDTLPDRVRRRLNLFQASAVYRDERFAGFDAIALVEVIEHVDASRLAALEATVFAHARPRVVVVTTPNAEHNVRFGMAPGTMRHRDHRFEWSRAELARWVESVASRTGYLASIEGVGVDDPEVGAPTQIVTFVREGRGR